MRLWFSVAITLIGVTTSAEAQKRADVYLHELGFKQTGQVAFNLSIQEPQRSAPVLVAAGLVGGTAGLVLGFFSIADSLDCEDSPDSCGDGDGELRLLVQVALLESLGLSAGVHIANRERGNFLLGLVSTFAIASVGGLALGTRDRETPALVWASIPLTQLVTSILIERKTAH